MSLQVVITLEGSEVFWSSYPVDGQPMMSLAMPNTCGLRGLSGLNAETVRASIEHGLGRMEANPWVFTNLEGDYDGVMKWLKTLRQVCLLYPHAKVLVEW